VPEEPVLEVATADRGTLAPQLAAATRLALEKMAQILQIPTDRGDGNLLRAHTAAAGIAVNAQLRADETRLKQVRHRDVMQRLLACDPLEIADQQAVMQRWLEAAMPRPLS
jgi:hypothetical protein